jgi:alpha-mannosidase
MNQHRINFLLLLAVFSWTANTGAQQPMPEPAPGNFNKMTLHVIPQTHIDLAWWWRYDPHAVRVVCKHTLETAFANMEKFPDYTFTFLQVPSIAPLEDLYPDLFYKMRYYVHNQPALGERIPNPGPSGTNGRLAIGSGLYCEPDGSIPCGESLVRQCLYGKRYFKHQFGIDVKTAWFQDAWTHPWTFPQILRKSGIDSYMYTRPRPEEKFMLVPDSLKVEYLASISKEQNERMFWWEAPDGSQVFAYKPLRIGGENLPDEKNINEYLADLNQRYGVTDGFTLIGVGNHGGGAIRADVERMRQVIRENHVGQNKAVLQFSTPQRFIDAVLEKPHQFPVIRDELVPTIRGIYTTQCEIKKGNRDSENLLLTLEKFAAIADVLSEYSYPGQWLANSWEKVLLNQFHDTISGTDVNPSIDDALRRYRQIVVEGKTELQRTLHAIAAKVDTRSDGIPIVVFNPLSWERAEPVETELLVDQHVNRIQIMNHENQSVPTQIIQRSPKGDQQLVKILFFAKVPSIGYACYWAKSQKANPTNPMKANLSALENEFFRLKIDSATGCLTEIFDKKANREVLSPTEPGNMLQIIEDFGDSEGFLLSPKGFGEYDCWTGKTWNVDVAAEIRLVESGPVRATLQIKKKFQLARFIQQIHLYSGIRRIEFELVVDWSGTNKMVKVAFPLSVSSDSGTYEIPYGTIARPSIGEEHVAQKWVDISAGEYGVSLLNDSRYGHDLTPHTIRLSVLRSPDHPVDATEEKGIHQLKYALYPHQGDWRQAQTTRQGYEFNNPLIAVVEKSHPGDLPARHAFLDIQPQNLVISVLKQAEDSHDLILRFYETQGVGCRTKIILSPFIRFDAVHQTDLLENELESVRSRPPLFEVDVRRYSIESYKLIQDVY